MANDPVYGLSEDDVRLLRAMARDYRAGWLGRPLAKGSRSPAQRSSVIFGVADSGIAGTTGTLTDPGSGTLSIHNFTSTGGTTDSGLDETVYNVSTVTRTTDEFTVCVRDYESGRFLAVAGSGGGAGYKKLCRFVLDAALGTSEASGTGKITHQYGDGTAHSTTGTITVANLAISSGYLFAGTSGHAGLAYHTSATNWKILQMECSTS
jgi:hypothetical protein